jgi:hypothetical protein
MKELPHLIHVDKAKEFHSEVLLQRVRHCDRRQAARQPQLGGHIERLIGTMMGAGNDSVRAGVPTRARTPSSPISLSNGRLRASLLVGG